MTKITEYQKGQRYLKALKGALDSNMKKSFLCLIQKKTREYYIYVFRDDDFSFSKLIRLMAAGIKQFKLGVK